MIPSSVFVTGGTGYIGSRLIPRLTARGLCVSAVARAGSERKLPAGCRVVTGDVLHSATYRDQIGAGSTFVHLVGVPHPSPAKARQFEEIDYRSTVEAIDAACRREAGHFVYISVAHPAPVMRAYWRVRERCERILTDSGLRATILRPWYVLGPGHWWPLALKPLYFVAERLPATRQAARGLGLVTIHQMVDALDAAVGDPPAAPLRVWEVDQIRAAANTPVPGHTPPPPPSAAVATSTSESYYPLHRSSDEETQARTRAPERVKPQAFL